MSVTDPLPTFKLLHTVVRMIDPFQPVARRERFQKAMWILLLLAFLCTLAFVWFRSNLSDGKEVEAVVVKVGTYPDPLGTGDSPILTVRLTDGSIRQLMAPWNRVNACMPGSRVSVVQRGVALKIGLLGCSSKR